MAENVLQPAGSQTWLCVRDAVFLLAHDEDRGFRRRLHPVTLNFALSAAVLCDLLLAEAVVVPEPGLVQPVRSPTYADAVTESYWSVITEPRPLRELLFRFAADVTARTAALLTTTGALAVHRDWLGRIRYSLSRDDLATSARLPARDCVIGEYTATGVTLCVLVRALGLHDSLLILDRSQLEPVLGRIEDLVREQATAPLTMIPLVADALRGVIEERVVGVMG